MPSNHQPELKLWWCIKCKRWLSSAELDEAYRHRECGVQVWRRKFRRGMMFEFQVAPLKAQDSRT